MGGQPPARRRYERPRAIARRGERVVEPGVLRYRFPSGREFYLADRETAEKARWEKAIIDHLRTRGLHVPGALHSGQHLVTLGIGQNLRRPGTRFEQLKRFSQVTRRDIHRQLAELLGRMHAAGISHNDLAPANVTWDGRHVGLIDFELAKRFRRPWNRAGPDEVLRHFGNDLGTFTYFAHSLVGEKPPEAAKRVVEHYPLSPLKKRRLLQRFQAWLKREGYYDY